MNIYKYIAFEKITPDIPRVWGEGATEIEAKLQCEIALREKLLFKLKGGCTAGAINTNLYIIKKDKPKITWLPVRRKNKKTGKLSDTVELMKVIK